MYNHLGNRCETISEEKMIGGGWLCHGQGKSRFRLRLLSSRAEGSRRLARFRDGKPVIVTPTPREISNLYRSPSVAGKVPLSRNVFEVRSRLDLPTIDDAASWVQIFDSLTSAELFVWTSFSFSFHFQFFESYQLQDY